MPRKQKKQPMRLTITITACYPACTDDPAYEGNPDPLHIAEVDQVAFLAHPDVREALEMMQGALASSEGNDIGVTMAVVPIPRMPKEPTGSLGDQLGPVDRLDDEQE